MVPLSWRTYQPSSDLWFVSGKEAVPNQGHLLHSDVVPWSPLWCWCGQGVPAYPIPDVGWWGQCCGTWLQQGRTYQPSSDLWFVSGKEAVPNQGHLLHSDVVPWSPLWCWCGQGVPAYPIPDVGWWGQCCGTWLQQG
ncbi:Aquaporin PIP1-3 like [Actinidia chinensis var. chinensis]|uniref:Aquaporin PIP1-3 like n=1 Tax=Actinidia chinensis var. chinensis TaxID=1590841 RepID=A0A2R6QIC5_ACTCC|nr:Aquaporin PIP1-3 like [Actinidia chinensis var. chinensis]